MLTTQQAAAKQAAHQMFDYRPPPTSVRESDEHAVHYRPAIHDEMPRFARGIDGIGIAGDTLRIYIRKDLELEVEIPKKIGGLHTEIVFTTGFTANTRVRRAVFSPVPCGVSAAHHRSDAGTLGCLVDTPNARCILSNNHILTYPRAPNTGDDIMHPGPSDLSRTNGARRIATLTDYEPINFGSAVNHIDAAIAALDDSVSAIPDIITIGRPVNPPVPAFVNQSVAKHGRTTGLTFGLVVDISFDGNVHFYLDHKLAYFENQIVIVGNDGPFSRAGDSGSLILDNPGSHPVGLLFAGDETHTLANPIQAVLNRFGATIVTT